MTNFSLGVIVGLLLMIFANLIRIHHLLEQILEQLKAR